jgi:hypothetical protein
MPQAHLVSLLLQATVIYPEIPIYAAPLPSGQSVQIANSQQRQSSQPIQQLSLREPFQPVQQLSPHVLERRINVYPQQPFPPSATATAGLFSRAEANPSGTINFIRKIQSGGSAPPSAFATSFNHNETSSSAMPPSTSPAPSTAITSRQFQQSSSAPPTIASSQRKEDVQPEREDEDNQSRESTPATPPYPRPGNGLMAKLKPDHEDLEWLEGEGEDPAAFSHIIFDKDGRPEKMEGNTITIANSA